MMFGLVGKMEGKTFDGNSRKTHTSQIWWAYPFLTVTESNQRSKTLMLVMTQPGAQHYQDGAKDWFDQYKDILTEWDIWSKCLPVGAAL